MNDVNLKIQLLAKEIALQIREFRTINGVFPKLSRTLIDFSEFVESAKS